MVRSANPTPVRLCDAEVFVLGAGVSGTTMIIMQQEIRSFCIIITMKY